MLKRVGNVEIRSNIDSSWTSILHHCNADVAEEIQLRSREDLLDLQYAIAAALREQDEWRKS